MGTRFELVLCANAAHDNADHQNERASGHAPAAELANLRAIGEEVIDEIHIWHSRLSAFEPGSFATRLMREARDADSIPEGTFLSVDPHLRDLLLYCEAMRKQTDGAFSLFHQSSREPSREDLALEFDWSPACRVRLTREGQMIDFGAIAKGFVLDIAENMLREHHVTRALIHGGTSSVLALGEWSVGIRLDNGIIRTTRLRDAHLSVSSVKHRDHITRTSSTAWTATVRTAAVIAPIAPTQSAESEDWPHIPGPGTIAEAWSTTLAVTGRRPHDAPHDITTLIEREEMPVEMLGPLRGEFQMPE